VKLAAVALVALVTTTASAETTYQPKKDRERAR
jgi:hypothetical protein